MKKLVALTLCAALPLSGCGKPEPPVAGKMSEGSVCSAAGYLIKQRLGEKFNPYRVPCSVKNVGENRVEIRAGYISPLGPTLHYTAYGVVIGDRLRIETIAVDGTDAGQRDFRKFPF